MIDFSLTEEQQAFQKTAREFAEKEIKPLAAGRDRLPADECQPWDMIRKGAALGFNKILRPEKYGGLGLGCREWVLVLEEIGAADIGVATSMILMEALPTMIVDHATEAQKEKWLPRIFGEDMHVMAIAFTEPDRAGSDLLNPLPQTAAQGLRTSARKDGDHYVINGAKSAWVTNAGSQTGTFLVGARTDMSKPQNESLSMFYVPANTPGLTLGKQTDKIGLRLADHAEIYFDNVRVPAENLIGAEGHAMAMMLSTVRLSCTGIGAVHVGLARAAYEYSLDYAKKRISWGMPIINHQAIGLMLADMQIEIDAARYITWAAAHCNDTAGASVLHTKCAMAKIYGTEMAVRVTEKAMNVLGAYGLSKEYPLEKWHRDALSGPIEDIHNIMWRLYVTSGM